MSNPTLHLSVINDGASYEQRKRIARNAIAGHANHYNELREIVKAQAQKEREQFKTTCSLAEIKEQTNIVLQHDREECLQAIRDAYNANPVITARAREWFDSVSGNSYHSVVMCVAGFSVYIPMQYGYGDQWMTTAYDWCVKNGVFAEVFYDGGHKNRDFSKIDFGSIVEGKKSEL